MTENNEIIAEFRGGKKIENKKFYGMSHVWINTPANDYSEDVQSHQFRYHIDWNWIMPVVEEIQKSIFIFPVSLNELTLKRNISQSEVTVFEDFNRDHNTWSYWLNLERTGLRFGSSQVYKNKIEAVNKAVVEFIKWYNEQHIKR